MEWQSIHRYSFLNKLNLLCGVVDIKNGWFGSPFKQVARTLWKSLLVSRSHTSARWTPQYFEGRTWSRPGPDPVCRFASSGRAVYGEGGHLFEYLCGLCLTESSFLLASLTYASAFLFLFSSDNFALPSAMFFFTLARLRPFTFMSCSIRLRTSSGIRKEPEDRCHDENKEKPCVANSRSSNLNVADIFSPPLMLNSLLTSIQL